MKFKFPSKYKIYVLILLLFLAYLFPSLTFTVDNTSEFVVSRVIDGDTVELSNGQKVRYIGIDTPESVKPGSPVECYALEAKAKNSELVLNKHVVLERDVNEADKYGRLLRYVWVDGLLINEILIKEGFAHAVSYPPDIKYQEQLRLAEREARDLKKGIWGANCD
ncbi:MAG: thermonuclease family protein [Patescibacteria group bacterium]